ncbi:MAG: Amuc_1100 family pilus-like protein [bacterium]
MKRISPDFLRFSAAALMIAVLGSGSAAWFSAQRRAAQKAWSEAAEKIKKIGGEKEAAEKFVHLRERILQTQAALDQAKAVLEKAHQCFQSSLSASTKETALNADEWKRMLRAKSDELRKLAEARRVELDDKFCCGFDEFRMNTPDTKQVADLTEELLASAQLCRFLLEEGVSQIKTVRRLSASKQSKTAGDFYRVYSFELEFFCKPDVFRRVLNDISSSPWLFVPQTLAVSNAGDPTKEKQNLPDHKQQPFFVISGNEDIQINMRVDFPSWNRASGESLVSLK